MASIRSQLLRARRDKISVKFSRTLEPGSVCGTVRGVGAKFFVVAIRVDASRWNGFQCFRVKDVRDLEVPSPHSSFEKAALKMRGVSSPRMPGVSLVDLASLLRSASRRFPLVTIHREKTRNAE